MTFDEVLKEYLEYARNRHKKQGFIIIKQNLNNYILPFFKDRFIISLTKQDIMRWQNAIISNNYSNKFNALLYSNFNCFIKYCMLCDYLKENIVLQVGPYHKRIENKKKHVYKICQFSLFI